MNAPALGPALRAHRTALNIRAAEAASAIGISRPTLSNIERGARPPTATVLQFYHHHTALTPQLLLEALRLGSQESLRDSILDCSAIEPSTPRKESSPC